MILKQEEQKNFAIIVGSTGYIAPRYLQAIRDKGNKLVAAFGKSDSVGILDKYFKDTDFFSLITLSLKRNLCVG